jgi:hypothetical protein
MAVTIAHKYPIIKLSLLKYLEMILIHAANFSSSPLCT